MKTKLFQIILLLSLIAPTTQAQIISKKVVKAKKNEYVITNFQSGYIEIYNKNEYFEGPCECALPDGGTMPPAAILEKAEYQRLVNFTRLQLKSKLETYSGVSKFKDNFTMFCLFDERGVVRDILFGYKNKYDFPIEKIENIEEFMKNDLIFTPIPEKHRKRIESANYTIMIYDISFAEILQPF